MNNITDYKKCKEILRKDFSKENNINKLLMDKVSLIDSYNFTFKHDEYATTAESLKRGFIVKVEDVAAKGFMPKDPFMSVNIPKAKEEINNRLDYLYLEDELFNSQIDFFIYLNKQKADLEYARKLLGDYDKDDKAITLEDIGRNVSTELANLMFLCGYSYKVYFQQDNIEDYKKQMINIVDADKDISEVVQKLNITYDELIEKIQNARVNREIINTNNPTFKVKDFYCEFINEPKTSNVDLINVYIKQDDEFVKSTSLNVNKNNNIVETKQLVQDFLCGVVGRVLKDGTIEKEYCTQGWFYKNFENFYKREGICYVSECEEGKITKVGVTFNDICEEVKAYLKDCNVDLNKIPKGTIESLAEDVFVTVDWQLTSSLIFGCDYLEGYIEDFPDEYFFSGKNEVLENE